MKIEIQNERKIDLRVLITLRQSLRDMVCVRIASEAGESSFRVFFSRTVRLGTWVEKSHRGGDVAPADTYLINNLDIEIRLTDPSIGDEFFPHPRVRQLRRVDVVRASIPSDRL